MKKGEIPWMYNEAFEPHYFSHLDQDSEKTIEKEKELFSETEKSNPLNNYKSISNNTLPPS